MAGEGLRIKELCKRVDEDDLRRERREARRELESREGGREWDLADEWLSEFEID